MSSFHAPGQTVIVNSLNQLSDLAKGELRAWLEPWFEARGTTITVGSVGTPGNPELGYAQITANVSITATTAATAQTVVGLGSVSFDGNPCLISFYSAAVNPPTTAGAIILLDLWDGSTDLGIIAQIGNASTSTVMYQVYAPIPLTPSAGSHSYSVRGWITAGSGANVQANTGAAGLQRPAYIRASRA